MNRIGKLKRLTGLYAISTVIAVVALLLRASPASATDNCLQNVYGKKKLVCTANDVSIASASNVRDLNGKTILSCNSGTHFSFLADFTVVTTATSRENVGLYFQTAGTSTALTGTCSDNIVSPLHDKGEPGQVNCTTGPTGTCLGTAAYSELDNVNLAPTPDTCGDTTSAASPEVITV